MRIIKSTLLIATLTLVHIQTQAGVWDSITDFFGGSGDSPVAESAPTSVEAPANDASSMISKGVKLIPLITQTLGVTDGQAKGGMGALLQAAQILLADTEYGTLANAIPGASALLDAAPAKEDSSSLMGTAIKMAGEQSDAAKVGLDLISQFKSLGMNQEMIPKFASAAEGYLEQSGSAEAGGLLTSALSFL